MTGSWQKHTTFPGEAQASLATPEDIVKAKRSYTGEFLKPVLEHGGKKKKRVEAAE
jgi:hypothetical protein